MAVQTLEFDVLVIGGGPGGYVAAIRAAQLRLKVACVERYQDPAGHPALGGTCLNIGCIPSKALLDSSHLFEIMRKDIADHGITVGDVRLDVAKMMARKERVVKALILGIAGLFKKHGITWLQGDALITGPLRVQVTPTGESPVDPVEITARHLILATGSTPVEIPAAPRNDRTIVDSTGALAFPAVPETLGIVGAGVIGLELGSVWRRLGSSVVILEALPGFLPMADGEVASAALKSLTRQGLEIRFGAKVTATEIVGDQVKVHFDSAGQTETLLCDRLVVAVGRRPCTAGLGLDAAGIALDAKGFIAVDRFGATNVPGHWAVGDVAGPPLLAHKAYEEGVAVAERIAGQKSEIDHTRIPSVVYTWPELAWVGKTTEELAALGRAVRVGTFPFLANGRAKAAGEKEGMVKIIADAETDEILGVHCFGPHASELIAEAVLAMEFGASSEDIARTIHAHPTLSEALHEAALAVDGRTLHS